MEDGVAGVLSESVLVAHGQEKENVTIQPHPTEGHAVRATNYSNIIGLNAIPTLVVNCSVYFIWIGCDNTMQNGCNIYNIHIYLRYAHAFLIGCAKDTFPKNLKRNCKRKYPCALLAKRKKCHTTYWQAMDAACKKQLTVWYRLKRVRTQCKKSCNNCVRK